MTCPWCRPALCACFCGYETTGKRRLRRRLPDEALPPAARAFRWYRRVYEDLRPIDRRYASGCLRLAAAVRLGPKQAHDDAAEALVRAIATRDNGRSGWDAEQLCRRYFRELYLPPELPASRAFTLDPRPGCYYVSARRENGQSWLVAGPWPTHAEAIAQVPAVRAGACVLDARGTWMWWGTARSDTPFVALLPPQDYAGTYSEGTIDRVAGLLRAAIQQRRSESVLTV